MGDIGAGPSDLLNEAELAAAAEEKETHAFEIDPAQVVVINMKIKSPGFPLLA